MKKILISILLTIFYGNCFALEFGTKSKSAIKVSMHYLIANPQKLFGQQIGTAGVIDLNFEETSIFTESESWKNFITTNALFVRINLQELGISETQANELNGKWVSIEGKFEGYTPSLNECQKSNAKTVICIGTQFMGKIYNVNYIYVE